MRDKKWAAESVLGSDRSDRMIYLRKKSIAFKNTSQIYRIWKKTVQIYNKVKSEKICNTQIMNNFLCCKVK